VNKGRDCGLKNGANKGRDCGRKHALAARFAPEPLTSVLTHEHSLQVQFLEGDYADFMAIDFACKERKIAVECDGPHHYLTELKKGAMPNHGRENGRTTAKRRLMEQMGWKVVNIDYKDSRRLNAMKNTRDKKLHFLRERLKEVGVTL